MIFRPFAIFVALLLSGCAVGPDYHAPKIPVPRQWSGTQAKTRPDAPGKPINGGKTFNDPVLNQLITDAIAANLDLKQALARVKDARAQRAATFATALPGVTSEVTSAGD